MADLNASGSHEHSRRRVHRRQPHQDDGHGANRNAAKTADLDASEDLLTDLCDRFLAAVEDEMSMAEWNAVLQRVIKTVHVHPDRVVTTPVTGTQANYP